MKDMSLVMKKAHKLTKEIKKEFPEVDYKFQLGICMSYLLNKEDENKTVELEGTEKQIAWAKDIKEEWLNGLITFKKNYEAKEFKIDVAKGFKKEIRTFGFNANGKITNKDAIERTSIIIDRAIGNFKNETSASKLITMDRTYNISLERVIKMYF